VPANLEYTEGARDDVNVTCSCITTAERRRSNEHVRYVPAESGDIVKTKEISKRPRSWRKNVRPQRTRGEEGSIFVTKTGCKKSGHARMIGGDRTTCLGVNSLRRPESYKKRREREINKELQTRDRTTGRNLH